MVFAAIFLGSLCRSIGQALSLVNFVHLLQFFLAQAVDDCCTNGIPQNIDCRSESVEI